MAKRTGNGKGFEALQIEVPEAGQLVSIEPVLESLSDLAARRDALRLMAERAQAEADRLDDELRKMFDSHQRELAALAAQQGLASGQR